jgi:hypothetical protein
MTRRLVFSKERASKKTELDYRDAWRPFESVLRLIGRSPDMMPDAPEALEKFIRDLCKKKLLDVGQHELLEIGQRP